MSGAVVSTGARRYQERMRIPHHVPRRDDDVFIDLASRNPFNVRILERLDALRARDAWLVAGCLYQTVWNILSDRPAIENIKDYDIFYFDAGDTSYDAEDVVIKRAAALLADLDIEIEVRNQARVHLWYEERFGHKREPLESSLDGIASFLVRGTCVAIATDGNGSYRVAAPHGLDDMFDGVLRANKPVAERDLYIAKASSYAARWPWLRVMDWEASE